MAIELFMVILGIRVHFVALGTVLSLCFSLSVGWNRSSDIHFAQGVREGAHEVVLFDLVLHELIQMRLVTKSFHYQGFPHPCQRVLCVAVQRRIISGVSAGTYRHRQLGRIQAEVSCVEQLGYLLLFCTQTCPWKSGRIPLF